MFNQILLLVYRLFLDRGRQRIGWIERRLGFDGDTASTPDDRRNEAGAYEALFSEKHRLNIEQVYVELLDEMNGVPYEQCDDALEALVFLQEISAIALWKFHHSLSTTIEAFVRDFDRLDAPSERLRLHRSAQAH